MTVLMLPRLRQLAAVVSSSVLGRVRLSVAFLVWWQLAHVTANRNLRLVTGYINLNFNELCFG